MEKSQQLSLNLNYFQKSKLFRQTLSPQASQYIRDKFLYSPNQNKGLLKLDLRNMCQTVVKELEYVEKEAAYDYVKIGEQLQQLGSELTISDEIIEQLQKTLYNLKDHIESIQLQMNVMSQSSNKKNISQSNRRKLKSLLSSFIQSAVLDKQLSDNIMFGQINENYINYIQLLHIKLKYLNNNLISPDSKAVKQLQPELQKLKAKASIRLRDFLIQQVNTLKKQKINIEIAQKHSLAKFKLYNQFLKQQNLQIYTQICNHYQGMMAKHYVNQYKVFLQDIQRLKVQLYIKTDIILPLEPSHLRAFLTQIKPTNLDQDKKSIFSLMERDQVIEQSQSHDIILFNFATQKGMKYTFQQIFKSINKMLMNQVTREIIFTQQFFSLSKEAATQIFGPLFRFCIQVFLDFVKKSLADCYDMFGILLVIAINERNKNNFHEKGCTVLDNYFNQITIILWPKFEQIFQTNIKAIILTTLPLFHKLQKATSTKMIIDRYIDLTIGMYKLFIYLPNSNILLQKKQKVLKRAFFDLILKVKGQYQKEIQGILYLLNILQQIYQACLLQKSLLKIKDFTNYIYQLQKDMWIQIDKISLLYMKELFPNLDLLIQKYCKFQQNGNQDSIMIILGNIDPKDVEASLMEVAANKIGGKLAKFLNICQKSLTGYSLKAVVKRFSTTFGKYYGEIYKYAKANHAGMASTMLQTHSMIKQLKSTFNKYAS